MRKRFISIFAAFGILMLSGCSSDFMEVSSTENVDESIMFTNTTNALMAINGIHRLMHESETSWYAHGGYQLFMLTTDLMADDVVFTKKNACLTWSAQLYMHQTPSNRDNEYYYSFFYRVISNANKIINNIDGAEGEAADKSYIKGQALAYRAFCYFNLVQMYGKRYVNGGDNSSPGVILRLENTSDNMPRATVEEVYAQINSDIDEAIALLEDCGVARADKSHINAAVAKGIKARIMLTQARWSEAAAMAKEAISESGATLDDNTYTTTDYRMSDAKSTEWLWAKISQADQEGTLRHLHAFISNSNASYNRNTPRCIYNKLYDKISDTDTRKGVWFPEAQNKKKSPAPVFPKNGNRYNYMSNKWLVPEGSDQKTAGDVAYMRLPELLLIEAEALARNGNDSEAAAVLYQLAVSRDKHYTLSTLTGDALIDEIMTQRRIELWAEGFRWFDLKRLNMNLDRGPAPRTELGYSTTGWKSGVVPTDVDPEASNYNMYDAREIGEENRYRKAGTNFWQWLFPDAEINVNPLCEQNPLYSSSEED